MTEIRTPNLLEAYQQGHEMRRSHDTQKARDGILAQYGKDPDKAAGLLMEAGDFDGARSMQDYNVNAGELRLRQEASKRKAQSEYMGQMLNMTNGLSRVPYEKRKEAFAATIAPAMQQMGFDPQMIAQVGNSDMSDENIEALRLALGAEIDKYHYQKRGLDGYDVINERTQQVTRSVEPTPFKVLGNGAVAIDPTTGEIIARNPKTFAPKSNGSGVGMKDPPPGGEFLD